MRFGYNTNGFAHHRLEDAVEILAEAGYQSVAITLDHHCLNPYADDLASQARSIRSQLTRLGMSCVVETGARFLLDPRRKHQPTLLSPTVAERERRMDFLCRAIDLASSLGADAVSFWSGSPASQEDERVLWDRLHVGCSQLADYAQQSGMRLAFEPEPGMFIDTLERFATLHQAVNHPAFGLTLDFGHLHCLGEHPIPDHLRRWRDWLWNVHLEDMRYGVHDHLPLGEGEMDFPPIVRALHEIGYAGGVHVELSRHSHNAVEMARQTIEHWRQLNSAVGATCKAG